MNIEKERFAAVMLNHWYVISRAFEIGRMRRHPRSKHYAELDRIREMPIDDIRRLSGAFSTFTVKNFYSNIEHIISNDPDVAKTESDAGLKVVFSRASQRRGMPIDIKIADGAGNIRSTIKALMHAEQNPLIKDIVEGLPFFDVLEDNSGVFKMQIPSARKNITESYLVQENQVLKSFNNVKMFLKLYQLIENTLSAEKKAEIMSEQVLIKFDSPQIVDGNFVVQNILIEETEHARNQRILRQKLEEQRRKRTQRTTSIEMDTERQTVTYRFDGQEHSPIILNLDVITHW